MWITFILFQSDKITYDFFFYFKGEEIEIQENETSQLVNERARTFH